MRGAIGVTGSSPRCSSTSSDARQSASSVDTGILVRARPVRSQAPRPRPDAGSARSDRGRRRSRSARRADGFERCRERVASRHPGSRGPPAGRSPRGAPTSSWARWGSSELEGSWRRIRTAPSSGSFFACSTRVLGLARVARAVDEPGVELALRSGDRLARLPQVGDVVQRVVEPEDVDPALGRRGDEPAREISADRPRTDEESASQRHRKRRLRARLERPDPLPWALDATVDGAVEDTASRDLEVGEAGAVRVSASRSRSAVGILPASGSWDSSRIVVSTSAGMWTPEPSSGAGEPQAREM